VFALPSESPNDGDRTLVTGAADPAASPFGWHDTNGVTGPEFTRTRGNNVHAYTDVDANNVPDPDSDPEGGASLDFDFPLDLTLGPATYRPAAVVNLFYWNNIVHDVTFGYGFDEAAGNFQVTNYSGAVGGTVNDGCEPFGGVSRKIALLERGFCTFVIKVKNAQNAGAVAVVVANNVTGFPITMGGADATIVIPSVMVSLDDANLLRANL